MEHSITLITGRDYVDITVNGATVRIDATNDNGTPILALGGVNCDLEGEAPGLYALHRYAAQDGLGE